MKISKSPMPAVVRLRRLEAGLTQVEACDLIHKSVDAYRGYERGRTVMAIDTWELFLIKTSKYVKRNQAPSQ